MSCKPLTTNADQTKNSDYSLIFSSVLNSKGNVRFINHLKGTENIVGFIVDDREFSYRTHVNCPTVIADLIDLAVAIFASDRLVSQDLRQKQRRLCIELPVRHPELLNTESFRARLECLLEWVTGSRWSFTFQKRIDPDRFFEHPSLPIAPQGCEVALWSGGLDALAGLYTHLRAYPEKPFMLFGTGSNHVVHAHQGKVAKGIETIFPGRSTLYRVPIRFHGSSEHSKNKVPRARGVVFTMLGAACAYLMGRKELFVYENGIGAINLPYRKSAVGLDHSRSVHPQTLLLVSDLVSELLKEEFRVRNPFLFRTKAEMCKALAEDGKIDLPPLTKSCDSPHRKKPSQCGYCSSCILRKQALAASQMEDKTLYVVPHGKKPVEDTSLYLRHMLAQVSTLRGLFNDSQDPNLQWQALTRRFPELGDIVDRTATAENLLPTDMQKQLGLLYQTYVAEWDAVEPRISVDLLNQLSDQQPSDDCLVVVERG